MKIIRLYKIISILFRIEISLRNDYVRRKTIELELYTGFRVFFDRYLAGDAKADPVST